VTQEEYDKRWDAIFNRDQPKAPEPIIEGELPVTEEEEEAWREKDISCPKCRQGVMMITGTGLNWLCDVCGYRERVEREEP
jgi:ribosomal protein S27AE